MKHIKRDFSLKAWVQAPGVNLGGRAEAKIYLFQNMFMLHIKLKLQFLQHMVGNILPTDTPSTQGWGQKVKPYIFVKEVMLLIKLKGIEHRAQ